MPNKMLIDASHPEETRVVVVRGNRIEEFDFESQDKKQLKGNIYLARVTRVEPSLQAAFVEYGGNRHGFLAFSEIHPDYYQIPVADRQALLRAEAEAAEAEDDEDDDERQDRKRDGRNRRRRGGRNRDRGEERGASADAASGEADESSNTSEPADSDEAGVTAAEAEEAPAREAASYEDDAPEPVASGEDVPEEGKPVGEESESDERGSGPTSIAAAAEADVISEPAPQAGEPTEAGENDRGMVEEVAPRGGDEREEVESVGAEDALEEVRNRRKPPRRHYKIQEVIKRRQILLVQVVKEERGNKGAALTTYLSLAGRYSVLMPNTARGGGISRKITNAQDRKRLKEVVQDLDVPQGMGVILRTAGESRTKAEIKRDYEYLMRMWETVRSTTLKSTAPALVYEEGSLIKRSVRDLYNKDIDEVLVAGDDGYREAKDFMRMLMPSHAKVVQPYRDTSPIFARNGIEAQLDRMVQPQVTLKSGGYIIINQTEALVSIDVNSGRSTKEHSIEDTALQTNLEAAEEVARQLRLRDLAGLIVIDFIDMEEHRNNRSVEKRLKDHLKNDRARIQVGRISHFGLMEMSRQRIRASVLESTMKPCPHCGGTGHVRSDSSVALLVVRAIEEFLLKDSRHHITVRTPVATALYVLNHKRSTLVDLERRFGVTIALEADETLGSQHYAIFRGAIAEKPPGFEEAAAQPPVYIEPEDEVEEEIVEEEAVEEAEAPKAAPQGGQQEHGDGNRDRKRKRRRRRRGGRDRDDAPRSESANATDTVASADASEDGDDEADEADSVEAGETPAAAEAADADRKKRRRGKRGGKRNRSEDDQAAAGANDDIAEAVAEAADAPPAASAEAVSADEPTADVPAVTETGEVEAEAPKKKPARRSRAKKAPAETTAEPADAEPVAVPASEAPATAPSEIAAAAEVAAAAEDDTPARSTRRKTGEAASVTSAPVVSSTTSDASGSTEEKPKKGGWWQRKGFF